jgi:hypothetical protein
MQISKELEKKVQRDYFFIKGQIDIDCNYFIEKIKEGVQSKENMNYRSGVIGKMTSWNFFNDDINFIKHIKRFNKHIDKNYNLPPYILSDSWGFINFPGEKTPFHTHFQAIYSGVIYLNDCNQPLLFKEIEQQVDPKAGSFCIFSPWLEHGCEINETEINKFGISFNMGERHPW